LDLKPTITAEREGTRLRAWDFTSQPGVTLRLYALDAAQAQPAARITLRLLATNWTNWLAAMSEGYAAELGAELTALGTTAPAPNAPEWAVLAKPVTDGAATHVWLAPRGIGLTAWSGDAAKARQIRRRFMLLGQTLDGMRVWDVRRAVRATREIFHGVPVTLQAEGDAAVNALYASLFEPGLERLVLRALPPSHRAGPDYLNVLRVWDLPDALAAARDRCAVETD
jgi:hypothetical protein